MKYVSKKRLRTAALILVLALVGLISLDVSTVFSSGDAAPDDEKDELFFPPAPETPRVKYLKSLSSPKDWKLKRSSLLMNILKKIAGIEDENERLIYPYGVTTDSQKRLFVVDSKAQVIHVFDARRKKYSVIKAPKNETFVSLIGIAADSDDNIYVSDSFTGKLFVFDRDGKFKKRLGDNEGLFGRPTGIAIDAAERRIYVVETEIGRVDVIDFDGKLQFRFGKRGTGEGDFNRPTQICVRGDRVYVTDTLNARVQIFDKSGKFISSVGRRGAGAGDLDKPKGVAVDSEGHIYVVEAMRDAVEIFDRDGQFLLEFGQTGEKRGEFYLPTAIHIDEADNIYVADSYNRRIQIFKYLKEGAPTTAGGDE